MGLGFQLAESFSGSFYRLDEPFRDHGVRISLRLGVNGMRRFLRERKVEAKGLIFAERLAERESEGVPLEGTLTMKLFEEKRIPYDLSFEGDDGRIYRLRGQRDFFMHDAVDSLTILPASLYVDGQEIGRAVLRFDPKNDLGPLVKSFRPRVRVSRASGLGLIMERLLPPSTVLLVVDVQDKLATAMPEPTLATLLKNAGILLQTAQTLGVRVIASEQYPKGLGATVAPLAAKLGEMAVTPLPKVTFDAVSELSIARALADSGAKSVVVIGMEAHVCVFQTARELVKRGYATYVVADAVASRTEDNRRLGLSLCEKAGATVTATETVAFDLLQTAGTDEFKTISKLLR